MPFCLTISYLFGFYIVIANIPVQNKTMFFILLPPFAKKKPAKNAGGFIKLIF